ncbi:MAG: phospholipase [Bryobacterales bacterium]|nr:phospholipase [Bryobacterales bacterium]
MAVGRLVGVATADELSRLIRDLVESGCSLEGVARTLEVLAAGREGQDELEDSVQIVTTGPGTPETPNRDTLVVVEEMFRRAERRVLVSGYAVYDGRKVFRELAARVQQQPGLQVQMFLDIRRTVGDTSRDSEIVWRFLDQFRKTHWPEECGLPEIYYDPRALSAEPDIRAALHAKCVVADDCEAFVSSANFTEAARTKNIELGVLIRSRAVASQIIGFFDSLRRSGHCRRAEWPR